MIKPHYIGRFAPSPTGPLHFGSLVTAVASYLDARAHQGLWLVRMEDIDPPREQPGAASDILRCLEHYGLEWDGDVRYQSSHNAAYEATVQSLLTQGKAFYCTCSRKALQDFPAYPGTCRQCHQPPSQPFAVRLQSNHQNIHFHDRLQGEMNGTLQEYGGDFVIKRKEGLYAYHLAVVLDDAEQAITHVVRGCDLLDSTFNHLFLQDTLSLPNPSYCHLPLVLNPLGQKLSKQNQARPLPQNNISPVLWRCLEQLGQCPPPALAHEPPMVQLQWGTQNWQPNNIPAIKSFAINRN